jgi:hypothetical protein
MDTPDTTPPFQWALRSIGVLGVLYSIGFVIETAHQDLLGIALDNTPLAYLVAAGNCLLDVVLSLFELVEGTTISIGRSLLSAFAVTTVVFVALAVPFERLTKLSRWVRALIVAVIVTLAVAKVAYFDAPVVPFKDLLFNGFTYDQPFYLGKFAEPRTERLWHDFFCTRADASPACGKDRKLEYARTCQEWVLADIGATAILWGAAFLVLRGRTSSKKSSSMSDDMTSWLVGIPLAIALLCIPYTYGKLLHSTDFRYASLLGVAGEGVCRGDLQGHILSESESTDRRMPASRGGRRERREGGVPAALRPKRLVIRRSRCCAKAEVHIDDQLHGTSSGTSISSARHAAYDNVS